MIQYLYGDTIRKIGIHVYLINTCMGESFESPIQLIEIYAQTINHLHKMIFNIGTFNKGYVEFISYYVGARIRDCHPYGGQLPPSASRARSDTS